MCKKVLVIDDNEHDMKLLREILEGQGYIVRAVSDALAAFETAQKTKPDVILMNNMMSNLDGVEVCRLIKADCDLQNIPILVLTAGNEEMDTNKTLESGIFDCISKPIDEAALTAGVQSALIHKENEDRLRELPLKDSLTGIYNHEFLVDTLEKEVMKNRRGSKGTAFIILDIDFFKKINDTYVNGTGDSILCQLADILTASVRKCDVVGRYGGEEFGIIFPEIEGTEGTEIACERLRQIIEQYDFKTGEGAIRLTISLGACYKDPELTMSAAEMMKKADDALAAAKRNGRNRVEIQSD